MQRQIEFDSTNVLVYKLIVFYLVCDWLPAWIAMMEHLSVFSRKLCATVLYVIKHVFTMFFMFMHDFRH